MKFSSKTTRFFGACGGILAMATVFGATSASAQAQAIPSGYFEGKWKDNLLCIGKSEFHFDNARTVVVDSSLTADFTINMYNQLTITGPGGAVMFGVQYVDEDTMIVSDANGAAQELHRCSTTPQAAKGLARALPAPVPGYQPPLGSSGVILQPNLAYLQGRWTETGNCANAMTIYPNGTLVDASGTSVNFGLSGNQITIYGAAGANMLSIFVVDQNTMRTVDAAGGQKIAQRCP